MHHTAYAFFETMKEKYPAQYKGRVLEIGSYNVNGTIRPLFQGCEEYVGVDIVAGPGVDWIGFAHEYPAHMTYDLVCSTSSLEHDNYWQETLRTMYANVKPGGLLIFTVCGQGWPEHGTRRNAPEDSPGTMTVTPDYYRNLTKEEVMEVLGSKPFSDLMCEERDGSSGKEVVFCGIAA